MCESELIGVEVLLTLTMHFLRQDPLVCAVYFPCVPTPSPLDTVSVISYTCDIYVIYEPHEIICNENRFPTFAHAMKAHTHITTIYYI